MFFFPAVISNKQHLCYLISKSFPELLPQVPHSLVSTEVLWMWSGLIQLVYGVKKKQETRSREGILSEGGTVTLKGCLSLQWTLSHFSCITQALSHCPSNQHLLLLVGTRSYHSQMAQCFLDGWNMVLLSQVGLGLRVQRPSQAGQ